MKKMLLLTLLCFIINNIWAQDKHNTAITSKIVTVNPEDWRFVGDANQPGSFFSDTIKGDALTKDVFETGAVLVYVLGTNGGGWHPLPHSYYGANGEVSVSFHQKEAYLELRIHRLVVNQGEAQSKSGQFPSYTYKIVVLN